MASDYSEMVATKYFKDIAITVLALGNLIQIVMLANQDTEVVVTPNQFYQELKIKGNKANEHYMTQHAWSVTALIGNVGPDNVGFVTQSVLKMFSPYLRRQLREALEEEATIIKVRKAKQTFIIEDLMYDPPRNMVWIWGTKTVTTKTGGKDVARWTYEMRIEPWSGVPRITHFDAYKGAPKIKDKEYVVDPKPFLSSQLNEVKNTTAKENVTFLKANDSKKGEDGNND